MKMARTKLLLISILLVCVLEIQAAVAVTPAETNGSSPSPFLTPPPSPNTVSWQTTFWVLVALALNAMTQNSTLDRHFPAGVLFPMRSSPVICAADMVEALLQLLACMYTGDSTVDAAKRVVQERMWQPLGNRAIVMASDGSEGLSDPPLALASQHPRTHTVVFVLGILPQAIKLFAMRGIMFSQACGAMYLTSFLVIASLGVLARRARGDAPQVPAREILGQKTRKAFWFGVALAQMGVWSWCLRALDFDISGTSLVQIILPIMAYGGFYQVIYAIALIPFVLHTECCGRRAPECSIIALAVCLVIFLGMKYISRDYLAVFSPMLPWLLTISVGMNSNSVIFAVHYLFLYDPKGTVKPSWVEVLG